MILQGAGFCTLWRFLKDRHQPCGPFALLSPLSHFLSQGVVIGKIVKMSWESIPEFYQPVSSCVPVALFACNPAELERHLVQVHTLISDPFFLQGTKPPNLVHSLFSPSPRPGVDTDYLEPGLVRV